LYEFNVLLSRKDVCHAVSRHLGHELSVYIDAIPFDFLVDPVLMDVDMFKLSAKPVMLLCDYL
jgi:hypothetical protein